MSNSIELPSSVEPSSLAEVLEHMKVWGKISVRSSKNLTTEQFLWFQRHPLNRIFNPGLPCSVASRRHRMRQWLEEVHEREQEQQTKITILTSPKELRVTGPMLGAGHLGEPYFADFFDSGDAQLPDSEPDSDPSLGVEQKDAADDDKPVNAVALRPEPSEHQKKAIEALEKILESNAARYDQKIRAAELLLSYGF